MTNVHKSITEVILERPLSREEREVLDTFNTLALVLFRMTLTTEAVEFFVLLMRLNNIAQRTTIAAQPVITIDAYQRDYVHRMAAVQSVRMGGW
ncbi:hypothetical protein [Rhodococcus ruber]|uniref:hypothetical protein n=1 Tax=Rhodococcus ruber TaxID=1830 RepID=UPI001F1EAAE7|nr:hypothetical protein [Rhodococcus ruber]MCF8783212.1 hypothetical protein [Rhodococcus ruber]